MVPPLIFITFCLLFFWFFLKFVFLPKHCKYVTVSDVSYGTWNSSSVNVFANKHHCTINKEWRQEATCLGCKMETSCLKVNKQQFGWSNAQIFFGFRFQRLYIGSKHHSYVWHWFQQLFCIRKSSIPHVICDICSLIYMSSAVLLLLIMPSIQFRDCM